MSKNITLMGASYTAVPAVQLPQTGGGTALFTAVSDTTAAAADVAEGKYFYTAAGVLTEGTGSGGGGVTRENIVPQQTITASAGYNAVISATVKEQYSLLALRQLFTHSSDQRSAEGSIVSAFQLNSHV